MLGSGGIVSHLDRTKTVAMAKMLIYLFLLASANAILHSNYDIVTKYNCWKKGEIFLDHGILFKFEDAFLNSWPGNLRFDCQMPITTRTKGTGIISIIQQMQLRKTGNECLDHVYFSNDNTKRCGEMLIGLQILSNGSIWNPPRFISEFAGPFLPNVGWTEARELVSSGASVNANTAVSVYIQVQEKPFAPGEDLSFSIAFTGFKECDGLNVPKGMFNCGYGVCILDKFVGDGIVNCPFGDCRDEGGCEEAIDLIDGSNNGTDIESVLFNSTSDSPIATIPFVKWLQKAKTRGGLPIGESEAKITEEIRNVGEEFKKHNSFLERISQILGMHFAPDLKKLTAY